jgi:hypothetical protein
MAGQVLIPGLNGRLQVSCCRRGGQRGSFRRTRAQPRYRMKCRYRRPGPNKAYPPCGIAGTVAWRTGLLGVGKSERGGVAGSVSQGFRIGAMSELVGLAAEEGVRHRILARRMIYTKACSSVILTSVITQAKQPRCGECRLLLFNLLFSAISCCSYDAFFRVDNRPNESSRRQCNNANDISLYCPRSNRYCLF